MLADAWAIENFASVAKCPSGQIIGQVCIYHTKVFLFSFSPLFGILVTKSVWSISVKLTEGLVSVLLFGLHEFYYCLQVNPTIPKYKRNKYWR
ncbi:unnamed protein product [Malus baccata var. baccata]